MSHIYSCINFKQGKFVSLQVQRINVCYWKSKKPRMYNNFPCFMHDAFKNKELLYGLPSHEYPGLMKVGMYKVNLNCIQLISFNELWDIRNPNLLIT